MQDRDLKYMEFLANEAADLSPVGGARIAALLVYKKRPVAFGYNHKKSNPFAAYYNVKKDAIYFHAETHTIFKALKNVDNKILSKCTLYVCRIKRTPNKKEITWGLSRPCEGCMIAITEYKIPRVVYSDEGIGNFKVMRAEY